MSKLTDRLSAPGPKRILSLDGGGISSVLTLSFLERLESMLAQEQTNPDFRLCDYFDLIGGTGTGSIIAAGLAIGMKASEIKVKYSHLRSKSFGSKKGFLKNLFTSVKNANKLLEISLKDFFGDITLGDQERIRTGLCIFTRSAETCNTWEAHNHPEGKYYQQNKDCPLWKVIMTSAAVPSYSIIPALRLLLLASHGSYPFNWRIGKRNMLMVSLGTGNPDQQSTQMTSQKNNQKAMAAQIPEFHMHDANMDNQLIMQILSNSPNAIPVNSEMGDLKRNPFPVYQALTYLRYNVCLSQTDLADLGYQFTPEKINSLGEMDNASNMDILSEIGNKAASKYILEDHFVDFKNANPPTAGETYFVSYKDYDLPFEPYAKKDIPIGACRIDHDFEIMTMEGLMHGKAGDYLIKGVRGEYYACDASVFMETYAKSNRA